VVYVVTGVVTGCVASGVCRDWRCYRLEFAVVYVVTGVVTCGVCSGVCRDWRCYMCSLQWCMS